MRLEKKSPLRYSIVIPVYNSEKSLIELTDRIANVFDLMVGETFEIIFVDDNSSNPRTWPTLLDLGKRNFVQAARLTRNFGQQPATLCGMQIAKGDFVITMDDDAQHAPEDIPKLLEEKSHDVVIGELREKKHNIFKKITSELKGKFDEAILGKPKGLKLSSFRLFNRGTVDGILQLMHTPFPFIPAMMFYVTRDVVGVPVSHHHRQEGKSGYSLGKMIRLFKNLLINNSSLLLRFIGNMGLGISVVSLLSAIYFVYRKFFFDVQAVGWTSIFVALLFIGGMVLFSLGVIGEYLIRILNTVEKRPIFLVREDKP